jgi:hypothetical protein
MFDEYIIKRVFPKPLCPNGFRVLPMHKVMKISEYSPFSQPNNRSKSRVSAFLTWGNVSIYPDIKAAQNALKRDLGAIFLWRTKLT